MKIVSTLDWLVYIFRASVLAVTWATMRSLIFFLVAEETLEYTAQPDVPPWVSSPGLVACTVSFKHFMMYRKPLVPLKVLVGVSRSALHRSIPNASASARARAGGIDCRRRRTNNRRVIFG